MSGALTRTLLMLLIACSARGTTPASKTRPGPGVEITLYRDHAVVAHRIDVAIPAAAPATIRLRVAAGVDPDDLYLVEKGELAIKEVRVLGAKLDKPADGCDEVSCVLDNYERACCAKYEKKPSEWDSEGPVAIEPAKLSRAPTDVEIIVGGPRAGNYSLLIGYDTQRIDWDAAYTVIAEPSRTRAEVRGALAIRNATGIDFSQARVSVVDSDHGTAQARLAKELEKPTKPDAHQSPVAKPRALASAYTIVEGDTRIELIAHTVPVRRVLVFDPIGPNLDYKHSQPVQDPQLGARTVSTSVMESVAFERDAVLANLPGGQVRLFERQPDGAVVLVSESTLFGTAMLAATVDTIPLHRIDGVTGKRERRELTVDNDRKRISEEFYLTIENGLARPFDLLVREHLYRGADWTIAYGSGIRIDKEGQQQIVMPIKVPAHATQTVLYVVVYSWDKPR